MTLLGVKYHCLVSQVLRSFLSHTTIDITLVFSERKLVRSCLDSTCYPVALAKSQVGYVFHVCVSLFEVDVDCNYQRGVTSIFSSAV